MRNMMASAFVLAVLTAACAPSEDMGNSSDAAAAQSNEDRLAAAVAASTRSDDNKVRDEFRNPAETLSFFGVEPDDMVVEIWPGGGWYTEILAPYLSEGSLAAYASERGLRRVAAKVEADPATYGNVILSAASAPGELGAIPPESADVVLTFRNVHNWEMGDEPYGAAMFAGMYNMLKPGGTLGVVEHRLPEDRPDGDMKTSGYMKQSTVIAMAEAAGFELVDTSEINANPLDNADHEAGVWTLLPNLRTGDESKRAIGESDRMTLKFKKPE